MEDIVLVRGCISSLYYLLLLLLPIPFLIFRHFKSPSNLPPGPYPWPILGNILTMGRNPHISLTNLSKIHGPLISLRLGTKLLVVGSSPAAATEILKTHDRVLSARCPPHSAPASPDRIHLSMGWADCTDQWKYLRTLCRTELFSAKAIESQANIRDRKVAELVQFLASKEGSAVKIGELVFAAVFNTLSNLFLSKDLIDLQKENDDEGLKGFVSKFIELLLTPNLADFYTILSGLDLQGLNKKSKDMLAQISSVWQPIIKERRENKQDNVSRQRDFLDGMLDSGFTDDQINYLFLELFFAGTDTSTSTVEWAMAELIKNSDTMRKVHVELEKEVNHIVIKESDLPRLPYLHSVVKETLRLHPPVPFLLPRRASEICKVMDYTIPKDTQVFVNVWAMGRDPKTWDDAMNFMPERFLESSMELNPSSFRFITFGAGRRICPGLPMAAKQVPLILANLINCFDWYLPHDINPAELDMTEKFGLSLQKEKPLVLIPKEKKKR